MTEQITPIAAAAHDRGQEPAQHVARHPARLRQCGEELQRLFGRPPDKLTSEDVRTYELHLVSRGLKPRTINPILCALRVFYGTTLGRSGGAEHS